MPQSSVGKPPCKLKVISNSPSELSPKREIGSGPRFVPAAEPASMRDSILRVYQELDRQLGELKQAAAV